MLTVEIFDNRGWRISALTSPPNQDNLTSIFTLAFEVLKIHFFHQISNLWMDLLDHEYRMSAY